MKKLYIIVAAMAVIISSGCKKYLDINTDPATPQTAEAKTLLPPLFAAMPRGVAWDARNLSLVVQNFAYRTAPTATQPWESHGYRDARDEAGDIWRMNYFGLGINLSLVIDDATRTQQYNYIGVAQALRAWSWQITTDYHGEIILKQAFEPNRFVFDYDAQPEVYAEVVRLANESIANLNRTDGTGTVVKLAGPDLVYHGDNAKWIKFNYGLLARNANNLVNKASYDPAKVIEYVDKSLAGNADNFLVPHTGTDGVNGNFFGPRRGNLIDYRLSRMIVGLLDGTYLTAAGVPVANPAVNGDPRINIMIKPSNDGVYRGVLPALGDPATTAALLPLAVPAPYGSVALGNAGSNPGAGGGIYLFRDDAPMPMMTYAEMQFIKAEAAFRMGNLPLAHEAYLNGISAHIDFVSSLSSIGNSPIPDASKTAYLTGPFVKQSAATLTMKDIMLQKYIALWGHGFVETWTDLRKFHYGQGDADGNNPYLGVYVLPTTMFASNGGKPAYRYRPRYNSEYLYNIKALQGVGADKADYMTYPMWFSEP